MLKTVAIEILGQLQLFAKEITNDEFSQPLTILRGKTIGKHLRHVLEFFDLLLLGVNNGVVEYDKRAHDTLLETDVTQAQHKLAALSAGLAKLPTEEKALVLRSTYGGEEGATVEMSSSLKRELAYNIEHAVHHMAIIKVAINHELPHVEVAENFGLAYSTIRHEQNVSLKRRN